MKQRSTFGDLMFFAGSYRYLTYASWVLSALSALAALAPFWYLWKIVREVLEVMPNFSQAQNLTRFGWAAVAYAAASMLIYVAALLCSHLAAFRAASNLRIAAMHHIAALPLGFAGSFGSGKLRKIVNESSGATETYLAHQLPDMASALATPAGLIALLLAFDWRLGLLSLLPAALGFLAMTKMAGSEMRRKMAEYQDALEDMSNEAVEYVRGIPVVKTFGQTLFTFRRFRGAIDRYRDWTTAYAKELRLPMMCYTTAVNGVFASLLAGAILMGRGSVDRAFLLNFIFYVIVTPAIAVTLTRIMFLRENAMVVDDAMKRIRSVLDLKPLPQAKVSLTPANYSIEVQDVTYSYDGRHNALDGVSLRIASGSAVAFVGPSGGGKTTLANLISRFFDPLSGRVLIGGVDIKSIGKEELMRTLSFVFQNSRLMKASILDNVKMGKPEASREEAIKALDAAQCADIIEKLPQGADTIVGARGVHLSGGEQQRIAIARALLKDSPIVILDEATAFADPDSESRVQAALSRLSQGKTVIMIAHRLSSVRNVDRIFVLKEGSICEEGSFNELIQRGGVFSALWNHYQTSINWKVAKRDVA